LTETETDRDRQKHRDRERHEEKERQSDEERRKTNARSDRRRQLEADTASGKLRGENLDIQPRDSERKGRSEHHVKATAF